MMTAHLRVGGEVFRQVGESVRINWGARCLRRPLFGSGSWLASRCPSRGRRVPIERAFGNRPSLSKCVRRKHCGPICEIFSRAPAQCENRARKDFASIARIAEIINFPSFSRIGGIQPDPRYKRYSRATVEVVVAAKAGEVALQRYKTLGL